MPMKFRVLLFVVLVALLVVPAIAFAANEAAARDKIEPEVSAAGIDLSGMTEDEALVAVRAYESELRTAVIRFRVKNSLFTLSPENVSLSIDEASIVDAALEVQRETGVFNRFKSWITSSREYPPVSLPIDLSINEERLDDVFDAWEKGAIAVPPYQGNIVLTGGRIIPEYPRPGEGIDRPVARELAATAILGLETAEVTLPTKFIEPELTVEQLNEWVEEAARYIDGPVTLTGTDPDVEVTFTRDDLIAALRTELKTTTPASFNVWFDAASLEPLVEPVRAIVEQPPRDAEVVVDEEAKVMTVIPARNGVVLDTSQVLNIVTEAALSGRGTGPLPYSEGAPPEITSEDIAAYGPLGLVSSFTTEHACCPPRVDNIHLFAEIVDGAIVEPGAEFLLNGHVGERTVEKGFSLAPTLVNGVLKDTVGGGVSQFATTFYNAVFYGCYEDVTHKPHSYYFSRYPEVNEATINWPSLDLKFRNDSNAPIWIKTNYTGRSITVEFYGNNGGRTCERQLGTRRTFTTPRIRFEADPALNPGVEERRDKGRGGWTNSVTRIMTWSDGTVEEQNWTWVYRAQPEIIAVHPCMMADAEEACPIQVIGVVGTGFSAAETRLVDLGFIVSPGDTIITTIDTQDGTVESQSIGSGEWVPAGTTIVLDVYKYEEEEPPPPTTTEPPPPPTTAAP